MIKIFVDFEMNPIPRSYEEERELCRSEIIQIGAVALANDDSIIKKYDQMVKPEFSDAVSPNIYRLTGITTEMLNEGVSFEESMYAFADWCKQNAGADEYMIYAWSDNDLIQLQQEMLIKDLSKFFDMEFMNVWTDFQFEFGEKIGLSSALSLDKAVQALDIKFEGNQHNALSDAINTAKLYQISKDEKRLNKAMQPVKDMMEPSKKLSTSMGSVFDMGMFDFGE